VRNTEPDMELQNYPVSSQPQLVKKELAEDSSHLTYHQLHVIEIPRILLRWSWLIVLCGVLGFVGARTVSDRFMTPLFSSNTSLRIDIAPEAMGTPAHPSAITGARQLVDSSILILEAGDVMDMISSQLLEDFGAEWLSNYIAISWRTGEPQIEPSTLRRLINMSSPRNAEILRIEAVTGSAVLSARICTIMAEIAPDLLVAGANVSSVGLVDTARIAHSPSSPRVMQNSMLGGVGGVAFMTAIILALHVLDGRIKDENEIKRRFNISVLAEIPECKFFTNKGARFSYEERKQEQWQ